VRGAVRGICSIVDCISHLQNVHLLNLHAFAPQVRARTVLATPCPLWNQILVLTVDEKPCVLHVDIMHSRDVDDKHDPSQDVLLGSCTVLVQENLLHGFTDKWYGLRRCDEDGNLDVNAVGCGKVRIASSFDGEPIENLQKGLVPLGRSLKQLVGCTHGVCGAVMMMQYILKTCINMQLFSMRAVYAVLCVALIVQRYEFC
jgi:hypothetical protein